MGKSTLERYLEKKKIKEEEEREREKTSSRIPLPSLSEVRLSGAADKLHIPESMREKSDPFSTSSTEKGTLERFRTKKTAQEVTEKLKTWYEEYSSYVSDYQSRTTGLTGTYEDKYSSGTSDWLADLTNRKNHLDKESDEIRGMLESTREVYGDKWTDAALVGLDMGRKSQEEILGGASSYNQYWSQWESEDKYNEWATYMRDREEKLSYDLESGAREIALLENRIATIPLAQRPFSPLYEELNSKKSYYNLAEQLQTYEKLKNQAISSPHFKSYAALGESDPRNINTTKGVKDDKYAGRYQGVAEFAANEDWLDHMTDEQREIYNYHVFADAQNGTNNAEKFLDLVEKDAQSAMYNKAYEKFDDSALGAVFYNAAANVVSAFTGIEAFISEDGSARHSGLAESIAAASENESLKDIDLKYYNIIDKEWKDTDILGKSLGQVASEGVGTVAHMLPSVLASSLASFMGGPTVGRVVGSGMLGLSAAGAGKQQMLDLGYSKEQATAYGALVGASETLLEYAFSGISAIGGKAWDALGKTKLISKLDNVLGNISVKAPSALVALGKTVGGMAGEAFEEGLQTIIEPWLESVVLGGDYEAPDWEEVAYSSLLGALSAAGLEGIGASVNVRQTAKTGHEIQNIEGGIQKLVDTGHSYSVDTVAHKLAGKIEAAINEGKKVNAYSIGKLFIEEGATLSEQNKNDIKRGLAEMNWDENSANVMTETYARFLDESIELSQEAIDIFTENAPFTRAVVNKLIGENTTTFQRQKGYVDLKRMVNGETSVKASQEEEAVPRTNNAPYAENPTEAAIKRVKADIEGDRNLLSAERSRKIAAEANKASSEDLARNALKVEGKYTSHGTGVTRLKNTHEKVSITDVVSAKDGNVRVRLNNNKVVDLAELDLASESDAVLYEAVARMGVDAGAAKLIVNGYDAGTGVSAEAYALGMAEAINNGKYNIKQISNNGFAAMLNPIQQKLGRDIGRMSAEAAARAEQDAINARVAKAKSEGKAKQVGGISYDASVDTESLTDTQKAQISVLEKVIPSLGVKVKLFASSVANEGGKRGFTTEDGQFTRSNGWYDPETGDIWVDVNAGADGKGLILVTAAHELTHFIRQWSPAKYKIFADFIISQYGEGSKTVNELVKERQDVAVERGYTLSYDEALEEVVARSCESFLQDSDATVKIAALAQKDKSLAQKVKSFVGQLLAKIRRVAKELGLAPDSEEGKYIASMETGLQSLYDMWTDALIDAGRSFSRAGVAVDGNTESASPAFSERTWSASEYVTERDAAARKLAESLGVSIAKAKKYIDNVNSIAKVIANDRVRLDYEASSFGSAFVSNVEYGGSFDYTTLCKKRRIYTGTFQEIQKRIGDEVLSPDDILEIRNMMIEGGIEATCGLCYVEGSRAKMGKFAKEFIKLYKRDNPDGWTPTMVDVNTPDGVEQMRINHPEAYDQYQYFWDHYGKLKDSDKALFASQQKPKLYEARKEYKGEILQHFKNVDTIAKKNRNGGIRMQSFSDFEIVHLIDTMQVIMDMSQVGLAGQAYTKVPEFAEAFGNTGLKINLSLIAKDVDANGNLVFDNREGMPAETAFKLRDKYSANVGTIIVTFTDEQLHAAMADPRIDFIIPFHRSQWKKSQYGAMGLPKGTKDYTYMQNEKLIKPTYHEFRGRMVKDKASNYMPNEYWDFSKTGKENAEAYLEMCAAENKRPKFYKLLDYDGNGKYSLKKDGSTDGYWKLLIDFKMYDNDGVGSPQMPVAPDFSMDEAMTMLDEYKGGHQSYPIAHGVVDKFVEGYKEKGKVKYSDRDADSEEIVIEIATDSELAERIDNSDRSKYDVIREYLIEKFHGQTFTLSDGIEAIMDKRDAQELSHLADARKTATLSNLRDIIEKAIFSHKADKVNHKKFDAFRYYSVKVSFNGQIYDILLNVGHSKYKDEYHIYDITNKKRTANQSSTGLSQPVGYAMKSSSSDTIISQPSENVNSKSKKMSERDSDYMDAVNRGDIETAQRMVDEAAKEAGYTIKAYHGTNAEFTVFDKARVGKGNDQYGAGFYFASNADVTELYGKKRYDTYLNIKKPVLLVSRPGDHGNPLYNARITQAQAYQILKRHPLMYDKENSPLGDFYDEYWSGGAKEWMVRDLAKKYNTIGALDGDVVLYRDYPNELHEAIRDVTGYDGVVVYFETENMVDERNDYYYVAWFDNQMKSAEPVVRDDNGNVIPLSERFNTKNPDIRYSEREDNVTEREILADTLMGAAANDIEKKKLKAYKAKVKEMEAEQEKLGKIKAQIKELSFAKGKRDTEKIKRLRELAVKTENRINIYDRQLLSLEATKPMRDLLERRVAEVGAREKAKATEKAKAQLSAVREQRDRKLAQQKAAFYDQKMRAAERHDKTTMRNKIRERVDSLNKLLLNPTKEKHIPMNLQKPVAELLSIINMESSDNEKVKAKLQVLKAEYEAIAKSEDPVIAAGYHPEVAERIGNVAEVIGDTALKDMNLEQLDYLYETLTIVENVVRNANMGFKIAKGKTITDYGINVMQEILEVGGKDHMSNDMLDAISRFKWANLKPVYAFERIGSDTFTELFNNVRAGEDTWATDVSEARAFFLEKAKKYKYFDWDLEKTQEFRGKFGKKFELTLPQMMSLYAYSKRKQADLHLEDGGFVFEKAVKVKKKKHGVPIEYTVKVADPFSLRKEHLAVIVASLTEEQRAFVDEMQTYLSSVMGAKGNEVAREMYGIDLFKETDYFPLKSSSYYLAYNPEKDAQSKVKNYGMAKETVKNANNPIILSDFMDVWGKHVDEMSMYHAFVLPMEDFSRVFNFNTPTKDDGGNKTSVQSRLTNAYGDEAVQYIKNLLTDLNGGARSDPNLGIINRLVGMFKKAKVFLSASVVIQQPSSIGRAFAVINPKYFTPNLKQKHGDAWNELKKYAPIATIKEMGYFDTNVGQSTVDYITGRDYNTLTEKIKGIATDKNYRDEAMGKLPSLADEMAWLQIWNAAKNEIADTTDLERGTEEFLNAAGKRFTEAVVKTQVYDSVLSRSAWMRSKDGLSKMLTSFMAEPTTTANMMSNAVLQASRGNKKHFAATLGAAMTSIVMNSMLVSLVYAARDDDEDEAFTEKYVESLVTELIEGVNPATYLPIVKDIWSLLQGYDVERSDMSLISDLVDAIYGMLDDNKAWEEKIERLAVTLADMSGVPLNNVVKDIRAAFRFGSALFDDIKPTDIGMEGAIKDAVIDSVPFLDKFIKSASKSDKLYKAITSGSEEDLERAESAYKTDTSLETAIKKGLRENDSRVKKAALALYSGDTRGFGEYVKEITAEGNFDSETVEAAVRAEASAYETKIEGAWAALEDGDQEAYKDLIRELRKAYKGILSQDEIVKAVSEYEKPTEEAEDGFEEVESIYKTSDINTALESGDTDHALEIVKEILEVKVENNLAKARLEAEKSGKRFVETKALKEAQTTANASVRSSLTSYWKKRYLEAFEAKDYAETERIRRLLHSTGVYGKLSELDADLKEWRKNN